MYDWTVTISPVRTDVDINLSMYAWMQASFQFPVTMNVCLYIWIYNVLSKKNSQINNN